MNPEELERLFTPDALSRIFPPERTEQFFEALLGDPDEGAYRIRLSFAGADRGNLRFHLELYPRPGKCLACHLTYGLPRVFSRHPVINIQGIVEEVDRLLGTRARCAGWSLGATQEVSRDLHLIPLTISLNG